MLLGATAAAFASLLFNLGLALQALEARKAPQSLGLRLGLLARLLRRPRWLLGQLLATVGVAPQVYALSYAPFVLVQPLLAVGLLALLAVGSRVFGEPVGLLAAGGVLGIVAGIALVAWGVPARVETHRVGFAVVAVIVAVMAGALAPLLLGRLGLARTTAVMIASGCGFAGTNIATKLLSDDIGVGHYLPASLWGVVGLLLGVVATITGMTAFQRRAATVVVPVTTSVQTFLPILLEPLFLKEDWASAKLHGIPIAAGTLLALAGTILISRTEAVARLAAAKK